MTAHPGTTRDALREYLDLGGAPVWLVDTAGLNPDSGDEVERLGVERSREAIRRADLVILVMDRSEDFTAGDEEAWREVGDRPYLLALNKADREAKLTVPTCLAAAAREVVEVSACSGTGIEALASAVGTLVCAWKEWQEDGVMITSVRHRGCLEAAAVRLEEAARGLRAGWSEELPAYELRRALAALEELVGVTTSEEVLGQIFATFCIGK